MKKGLFFVALAALFATPLSLQAQEENINLGKQYGNYEIKLTKDKWTTDVPVTAIWDNATGVWVTAPKIKNKEGALFLLPKTDVEFFEGDRYIPEVHGWVQINDYGRWAKGIENPKMKWLIWGCGIYKIENDKLVPVVESGDALDVVYNWEARYAAFWMVPHHALIIGAFNKKDKVGYSIFSLDGERLYNDLNDFKFKEEPSLKIQLEDGSWHHLDPMDGSLMD
jgi:hypothetical protein